MHVSLFSFMQLINKVDLILANAMTGLKARRFFSKLSWQCQQAALRLGVAGSLALLLLIAGLLFHFYGVLPAKKNVTALSQRTEQLQAQVQNQKVSRAEQVSPSDQLAAFYNILPKGSSAPDELNKLYEAAKTQNLILEQGEYRMIREDGSKIARYEIVLPVKGSYVQIRKFVNQVLKEIPTMALEGITFQRQKVGESVTQSQIRFTLFLGEG